MIQQFICVLAFIQNNNKASQTTWGVFLTDEQMKTPLHYMECGGNMLCVIYADTSYSVRQQRWGL